MMGETKKSIAILPLRMLGDSLVFTILAQNFSNQQVNVTYFSNTLSSIDHWLPDFTVKPYSDHQQLANELQTYDALLCDPHDRELLQLLTSDDALRNKTAWITATRMPEEVEPDHEKEKELAKKLFPETSVHGFSDTLRHRKRGNLTMVGFAQDYCQSRFSNVAMVNRPRLEAPKSLIHRKCSLRVIIFPLTPNPAKNYSLKRYLQLAEQLRSRGFQPEFILTQDQVAGNQSAIESKGFEARLFGDINSLAEYVYESGCIISNDSGGGHLASFLDVPVVTLYKKKDDFEWRPGWRGSKVIRPKFSFKWKRKRVWSPFVSHRAICSYVEEVTSE